MADVPLEKTKISLDDLLKMGDARVEIIDGEIVEMAAAGAVHHLIAKNIFNPFDRYVTAKGTGTVFFDGMTYLMFSPEKRLKDSFVPDVSFITNDNIPAKWNPNKPHPGVPEFAVEVISPGDDAEAVQKKRLTYLSKGTQQIWNIYPATREVHQFRRNGDPEVRIYRGSQRIDVEDMFPGLEITTDMIFDLPQWAIKD